MIENPNKKKILFIGQLPPPMHGASLMNSYVINSEVIRHNFSLVIINLQFAKSIKEITRFSFLKVYKAVFYAFLIVKRILLQKPDLIYFTVSPVGFAFIRDTFYVLLFKLFHRKIVFHLHGKGIKENAKRNFLIRFIYTWVFKNSHIICLSKRLAEDIENVYHSIPFIVPNGIQVHQKLNQPIKKSNESPPQILYLSNYIRNKGMLILIEALSILKSQGYYFNARFVGAPFDLTVEMLESKISEQNLNEYVKLIGPLYGNDKIAEFQKADIFVFPTYYKIEAFPLVILEAFQFALPVISTFEGGIPDMGIDNVAGFLVETKNPQKLAEKIATLLNDKELRLRMGKKGYYKFKNNYTLAHFENNINKTFQAILGIP
jgi:glycosyltransferase involved in cell wall biosynthesis